MSKNTQLWRNYYKLLTIEFTKSKIHPYTYIYNAIPLKKGINIYNYYNNKMYISGII